MVRIEMIREAKMIKFEYAGTLYNSYKAMAKAAAIDWLTASGQYSIADAMKNASDAALTQEIAYSGWLKGFVDLEDVREIFAEIRAENVA